MIESRVSTMFPEKDMRAAHIYEPAARARTRITQTDHARSAAEVREPARGWNSRAKPRIRSRASRKLGSGGVLDSTSDVRVK